MKGIISLGLLVLLAGCSCFSKPEPPPCPTCAPCPPPQAPVTHRRGG